MLDTIPMDEVSDAILGRKKTHLDVAAMDVVDLLYRVHENRWEHPELDQLPVSDEEIAQAILEHALSKAPDSRVIVIKILAEQRRQSRYLRTIAWAAGLWLVLVILGMIGWAVILL